MSDEQKETTMSMINWAWWTLPAQIAFGLIGADVIRWLARIALAAIGRTG